MLLSRLDQTGMTTHTIELAEALVRKGHNVTILTGWNKIPDTVALSLMDKLNNTGAKIKTFFAPDKRSKLKRALSAISLLINVLMCKGGVIHVQSPYLSWAPWLLGRKFISTLHVADLVRCVYYKNATHLIAISNETKEYAKNVFCYKESEISIINHGVSADFATLLTPTQIVESRQHLELPVNKLLLTIVGSIEPRKGHDILLKAVTLLPCECRNRIHIVFLGSDKSNNKTNTKWLNKIIEETQTKDIISHFEYQSSKLFYKISDVFILPSWVEGFPLVTIEAMLSGNLCIRTDAEGAYEQIMNGVTGYIFPKGDVVRLAQILKDIILNDELRASIAVHGRDYALSHFTSDIMAEHTLSVYKSMITNGKKKHINHLRRKTS